MRERIELLEVLLARGLMLISSLRVEEAAEQVKEAEELVREMIEELRRLEDGTNNIR